MLELLLAASISTQAIDFFSNEPMLSGSRITYCLKVNECMTLDRTGESAPKDLASIYADLSSKLYDISKEFYSLDVKFPSEKMMKLSIKFSNNKEGKK